MPCDVEDPCGRHRFFESRVACIPVDRRMLRLVSLTMLTRAAMTVPLRAAPAASRDEENAGRRRSNLLSAKH